MRCMDDVGDDEVADFADDFGNVDNAAASYKDDNDDQSSHLPQFLWYF